MPQVALVAAGQTHGDACFGVPEVRGFCSWPCSGTRRCGDASSSHHHTCTHRAPPRAATAGPLPCPLSPVPPPPTHWWEPPGVLHPAGPRFCQRGQAPLSPEAGSWRLSWCQRQQGQWQRGGSASSALPKGRAGGPLEVPGTQLRAGRKGWTPAFCSHQGHTVNVKPRFTGDHRICCFFFPIITHPVTFPSRFCHHNSPNVRPNSYCSSRLMSPNATPLRADFGVRPHQGTSPSLRSGCPGTRWPPMHPPLLAGAPIGGLPTPCSPTTVS